jgi:hypothetical protein
MKKLRVETYRHFMRISRVQSEPSMGPLLKTTFVPSGSLEIKFAEARA